MKEKIMRGEIYLANLDPAVGSEQGGERPVLIVQNNKGNKYSPTVIVVAVTSHFNKRREMPTHIPIECKELSSNSIAMTEQMRTLDKSRLEWYIGKASRASMKLVDKALKISIGVKE